MDVSLRRAHWDNIYAHKQPNEMSWTEELPSTSLKFIHELGLSKDASIIDIGGGDSKLADSLLQEGYTDITVLDISKKAIERAKQRLGGDAEKVKWIVSDVTEFKPERRYDCWHDRAAFHFLTLSSEIDKYLDIASDAVKLFMVIGTFSDKGPTKCSTLNVRQYTEEELQKQLQAEFDKIRCITEDHFTPFQTSQNFLFCSFKKKGN